jgi:hypothetical protein
MSAGSGGYTVLDAALTVEHIMPQKLSREWQNALGPLCHQVHTGFLNSFGNLTLVTAAYWENQQIRGLLQVSLTSSMLHVVCSVIAAAENHPHW